MTAYAKMAGLICGVAMVCGLSLGGASAQISWGIPESSPTAKEQEAPPTGPQWRLEQESVAANSKESYLAGADALLHSGAMESAEVSKLFFHGSLSLLPAGTLVAGLAPDGSGAKRIRIMDGSSAGKTMWMFTQSAEKLGFKKHPQASQ